MKVRFAFGKHGLELALPQGFDYQLLETRFGEAMGDVEGALAAALDAPIGRPPISELARGKRSAAIAVCDITRPAPNRSTLPPLLERLHAAGMARENVTLLIATGLHRAATADELEVILGREIATKYRVISHAARERSEHRFLGNTRRGTPVWIDDRFVASDLHITLGFIEQHLMAGFSGGRKLIAPGLAAQETIKVLHSPQFMREKMAFEGSIEQNPLHHELLEIARMARHDFMLDVALTPARAIAAVFAGDGEMAHAAGVRFVQSSQLIELEEYADAAITSAAGYPLDTTFYQTVKGVTAAQHIVKPEGKILVVGECSEGIGSAEFAEKLRTLRSYDSYLAEIASAPVEVDQWQLEKLAIAGQRCEILFLTPGVRSDGLGAIGAKHFAEPEAALSHFFQGLPARARIALIPEGPYVFAQRAGDRTPLVKA
jgi:lactate racemase